MRGEMTGEAPMMALRRHALEGAAMVVHPRWPGCRAGRGACSAARAQVGGKRASLGGARQLSLQRDLGVRQRLP